MSTDQTNRINFLVLNTSTTNDLMCTVISCEGVEGLSVGDKIGPSEQKTYQVFSNNRVFVSWIEDTGTGYSLIHQMAMTCPKSSSNSACGITKLAGLQAYEKHGTPVDFVFFVGTPNLADWDNGMGGDGSGNPTFGDCSVGHDDFQSVLGGFTPDGKP